MTTNDIVVLAIVAGTCWIMLLTRCINHAAKRIIEKLDELGKKLETKQNNIA
jgi:hypothetical protein